MRAGVILMRFVVIPCLLVLVNAAFILPASAADVGIDAVTIEPASPGPSTLCKLMVRLRNAGAQPVSYLKFNVRIDGQEVPTYTKQRDVVNIDPGPTDEVGLFNFYSPSVVKAFDVEVTLVEAQWVQVQKAGATTTTTPSGPVADLPTSATRYVNMSAGN